MGARDNTQWNGYMGQEGYVGQEGYIVQEGRRWEKTRWEVVVLNGWEAEEIGGNFATKINVLQSKMT